MTVHFDLATLPSKDDLAREFAAAAQSEPAARHIAEAYRTGVMFRDGERAVTLNESCIGEDQGQMLWHLTRALRPECVIETGFGRGTSSAFFLSALAPWSGSLVSIDPAFRHWAGEDGIAYISHVGGRDRHTLLEQSSELALAMMLADGTAPSLSLSYIDGSHHFDGTLIDFIYLDRMTQVGGIIGIDDAHAPAVRTLASFLATNYPYRLHYASMRLLLCQKLAMLDREWCHFRPFTSSTLTDWNVHQERPDAATVPNASSAERRKETRGFRRYPRRMSKSFSPLEIASRRRWSAFRP